MSEWTYHVQDARTDAWISRDFPLTEVEIVDVLTGHCSISAKIAPETPGVDLLEEWGVWIYAEKGDQIRAGGLLAEATITDDGNSVLLDIRGLTDYANGQPYGQPDEKFRLWEADPLDCFREVWRYLLSFPRSPNGVVIDGDTSPVTISDVQPPDKPVRADVTYPTGSTYGTAGAHWSRPAKPVRLRKKRPVKRKRRAGETDPHWDAYVVIYDRKLDAWKARRQKLYTSRLPQWNAWHSRLEAMRSKWEEDYGDREPYKLSWWEETDCGAELDRLAQEGNFEWRERHTWTDGTKAAVEHRIQLAYPHISDVVHTDGLEVGGSDLVTVPDVTRAGEKYANVVFATGAGEGRKTVRYTTYYDDGRLRRAVSLVNKAIKRRTRLGALARDQLSSRLLLVDIPEVTIWDLDGNLGNYRIGDVTPVTVDEGWNRGTTMHRIVGRSYKPDDDDTLTLQLVRAERSPE